MSVTTTVKKSNLPIIFGILLVIVVVLAVLAFQFILVPQQVVSSVNKNIDSYNKVVDISSSTLKNLDDNYSLLFAELGKTGDTNTNNVPSLDKLKSSKTEFDSLISKISSSRNSLDKGPNKDSQDFQEAVSKNLDESKKLVESYKESTDYLVCISENFLTQAINLKNFGAEAGKLATLEIEDPSFLTSVDLIANKSKENSELTKRFNDCFTGNFAKYKTTEVVEIINSSIESYTGLSTGYSLISSAIKDSELSKLNEGIAKVTSLGSVPAIFEKRFATAVVDKPIQEFEKKADDLEKLDTDVKSKRDEIKKKYSL